MSSFRVTLSSGDPTAWIPHRPPLLCIDRLVAGDRDWAVAERLVRPGPEVEGGELWEEGLIEGLTQTAALFMSYRIQSGGHRLLKGMLVGIRGLAIERRARVGEVVRFRADLVKRIDPFSVVACEATAAEELLVRGEMKFYVLAGA